MWIYFRVQSGSDSTKFNISTVTDKPLQQHQPLPDDCAKHETQCPPSAVDRSDPSAKELILNISWY